MTLSLRKKRFVEEYLLDGNATRAAERAGYHPSNGRKLTREPAVAEAINQEISAQEHTRRIIRDQVIDRLKQRAFFDPRALLEVTAEGVTLKDVNQLTPEQAACLEMTVTRYLPGHTVHLKLPNRQTALRNLARALHAMPHPEPIPDVEEEENDEDYHTWSTERIRRELDQMEHRS